MKHEEVICGRTPSI